MVSWHARQAAQVSGMDEQHAVNQDWRGRIFGGEMILEIQ